MISLSVVVLTHNDEKRIKICLSSLSFASELILIDDYSSDRTIEIAKKFTAKIFKHHLNNDFSAQRNFGLSKATNDWVLFIDSDEVVSKDLGSEIISMLNSSDSQDGFFLKRYDVMWGKTLSHGEVGGVRLLRLAKRNSGTFQGKVHETWEVDGKRGELTNPLYHYPHETIGDFVREISHYSSIRAQELYAQKVKVSAYDTVFFPSGKFLMNYVVRFGFLDGIAGFVFAICMSFHSFLVRGKLWMLYDKK